MTDTSTFLRSNPVGPVNRSWLILALLVVGIAVALLASFSSSPPEPPVAPSQVLARAAKPAAEPVADLAQAPAPPPGPTATVSNPRRLIHPAPLRGRRPARTVRSVRAPTSPVMARDADQIGDLLDDAAAAGMTSRQPIDDTAGTRR